MGALDTLDTLDALDALGKRFDTSDQPKALTGTGLRWSAVIRKAKPPNLVLRIRLSVCRTERVPVALSNQH